MIKRFLVVGHEAREHALAWKLVQSPNVEKVYIHSGNYSMLFDEKFHLLPKKTFEELATYVIENKIDCTIVGDTSFMEAGIVDLFNSKGLAILGAPQASAQLEASKLFSKNFMRRHGVPTAHQKLCPHPLKIKDFLNHCRYPMVLKSDQRVASDKSAVIVRNKIEAAQAYLDIFGAQKKRESSPEILVEEFLIGREISYAIVMDGTDWVPLVAVRDYKRLQDADHGPDTGGMGSYAPVPWLTAELEEKIKQNAVLPTLRGMHAEGLQYRGFLYFGIMIDAAGNPWALEYNTRLGDTEAESTLMLLDDDFSDLVIRAATESVKDLSLKWRDGCAISVALAPEGYPANPIKSPVSLPFPSQDEVMCFGSIIGRSADWDFHTGQGRLACVTGYSASPEKCRDEVYEVVRRLDKDGLYQYRSDIGLEPVV